LATGAKGRCGRVRYPFGSEGRPHCPPRTRLA